MDSPLSLEVFFSSSTTWSAKNVFFHLVLLWKTDRRRMRLSAGSLGLVDDVTTDHGPPFPIAYTYTHLLFPSHFPMAQLPLGILMMIIEGLGHPDESFFNVAGSFSATLPRSPRVRGLSI